MFNGVDVTGMPPAKRQIAMVFQSYALYPHLNEAIAFSLTARAHRSTPSSSESLLPRGPCSWNPRPAAGQLSGANANRLPSAAPVRDPGCSYSMNRCRTSTPLRVQMRLEAGKLHATSGPR